MGLLCCVVGVAVRWAHVWVPLVHSHYSPSIRHGTTNHVQVSTLKWHPLWVAKLLGSIHADSNAQQVIERGILRASRSRDAMLA